MCVRLVAMVLSALLASPAAAQDSSLASSARSTRGALSVTGLALLGVGVGGLGLGLGSLLVSLDSSQRLAAYGTPSEVDAQPVALLRERAQSSLTLSLVGFIAGAVLVAGGAVLLAVDTPRPLVAVVVPLPGGAALSVAARF